ncbi:PREDICTED: homeobox-DDT domain protein RLT1-like [Ipomoea nil]|uniref:homeobox-DDT domain protein RLT1-like n=1 Tax=Ipomoea nil TaxID=35883 RepID=UPI000901B800|nr:PREDICTED: homeobox-DDT domain protein RLT1-like [Ipomoea nil]
MEIGSGSGSGSGNDNLKWKATSQIEILETIYAVEPFPSQELIAELSAKLELSDQQLRVWFEYKREKDQRITIGVPLQKGASTMPMILSNAVGEVWGEPVFGSPYGLRMVHQPGVRVPSYGNEGLSTRQYDQLPWTILQHSRAVAAVEAQLRRPLIENGPVLGFKFDPLPPGAFRSPIGEQSPRAERHGGPIKGANQTSLQYQFTQGEPSSGAAAYGPRVPPRYNTSPAEAQGTAIALSGGNSYVHGTQLPISGLLGPQGRPSNISRSLGVHVVPQSSSRLNRRVDDNFGGCSITGEENPLMPSETQAIRDNRILARIWKIWAQPWIDSDKNVTNLLMVWRFLICFADALSLSPFTIDEFVQALQDSASGLLGQVHIMLLRSIIKDIEVAGRIFVHLCEGRWRLIDSFI